MSSERPTINGEPTINSAELAVLLGVTEAQIRERCTEDGPTRFPEEWWKQGRRRANEYAAHTGRTDMAGALEYWQQAGR